MKLFFTESASRDIQGLSGAIGKRIVRKMQWFAAQDHPLSFAKPLKGKDWGAYRFRVGDYRVLVDVRRGKISVLLVLAVRHRRDAYRL